MMVCLNYSKFRATHTCQYGKYGAAKKYQFDSNTYRIHSVQ
jgi:hypothetical protein